MTGGAAPPTWGDPLRYLTDDRDYRPEHQRELVIMQGGNGDYYVQVVEPGHKAVRGVRICMSGGASSENPALARAIADAYRALYNAAHGIEDQPSPIRAALAGAPPADLAGLVDALSDCAERRGEASVRYPRSGALATAVARHNAARAKLDRALAALQQRAERAEGENTRLRRSLETSTVRLEICRERFAGCDDEGDPNNLRHPVSALELPAWIEEQRAALASPAERTGERAHEPFSGQPNT